MTLARQVAMIGGWLVMMLCATDTLTASAPVRDTLVMPPAVPVAIEMTVPFTQVGPLPVSGDAAAIRAPLVFGAFGADTTPKKRKPLVSYSDWYGRRLAVHRALTWTMIPLFAVSYYTGERLARDGRINSPYAVRALHPYAATGAAAVFGVNTVTGVWNLWDARHDPEGRKRRIAHSVLFMIADAGFAYGGSIGNKGRTDGKVRDLHRTIALSSMGVSYVSMMLMLLGGK